MKKIFSMFVLAALLLSVIGISASAATLYSQAKDNIPWDETIITVKKGTATIDGKIDANDKYEEFTGIDGKKFTEYFIGGKVATNYNNAVEMAKTVRWFFSWDGTYLNIAAQWNAKGGATQAYEAGTYFGDYDKPDEKIDADEFLAYGPGMNINSDEQSSRDPNWARFNFAVSENTTSGQGLVGYYTGQNGQADKPYIPVHGTDFDFGYAGDIVTAEWKIPVYQLDADFSGQAQFSVKATVELTAGMTPADLEEGVNAAEYAWGVRLGNLGYMTNSGNMDRGNAQFRLTNTEIAGTVVPPETNPGGTETQAPDTTGTQEPGTQPGETGTQPGTQPGETGTQEPGTQPGETGTQEPGTQPGETGTQPGSNGDNQSGGSTGGQSNNVTAPPTGDPMIIAAVVSAISACGVMIAKKRR